MRQPISLMCVMCVLAGGVLRAEGQGQSAARPELLVVNQGDSNVGFVDPATGRQVATMAENTPGIHGHEIAVSPDGKTAYLPIYGSSGVGKPGLSGRTMQVIDVPTRKVVGLVDFGHDVRPHLPVLDASRGLLYVTTELDKTITVIDTKTLRIVGVVPTGAEQSHMLVLSHDGRRGYTANVGPGSVSVLDMLGRKTLALVPVEDGVDGTGGPGGTVQRIAISNDDKLVFTADQRQPRMAVIDTATKTLKGWIALPGTGYGAAPTPDGRWLVVAIPDEKMAAVVDLKAMKVVRTIPVPAAPQEVLIRPDGKVAYVSCNLSGEVAAIGLEDEPAAWTVQTLIAAGKLADGLGWAR